MGFPVEQMDIDLEQEKLGELLVDRGVLSHDELDHALDFQENVGGKLGDVLVQLGLVTDEEVIEAVAEQQNLEIVDLTELVLPQELIDEIPQDIIEKHEVIPIGLRGHKLRLAIHDPFDLDSIEKVGLATDYHIEPVLAPRDSILQVIDELFYEGEHYHSETETETEEGGKNASAEEVNRADDTIEDDEGDDDDDHELSKYDSSRLIHAVAQVLTDNQIVTKEELVEELEDG